MFVTKTEFAANTHLIYENSGPKMTVSTKKNPTYIK